MYHFNVFIKKNQYKVINYHTRVFFKIGFEKNLLVEKFKETVFF